MSTAVEQSLQIALQEPAAAIAVAVLLGGGLVGMSIRTIVESVVIDGERGESDDSDRGVESATGTRETAPETGRTDGESDSEPDPEELENRLDTLENEVGSLSSTVDSVRAENAQISESVDEVEANTGRLVSLFRRAMGGSTATSGAKPAQSEQSQTDGSKPTDPASHESAKSEPKTHQSAKSEPKTHQSAKSEPKTHQSQQERETEVISESLLGGSDGNSTEDDEESSMESGDEAGSPGIREKHCVDSDEEIIDAPGQSVSESEDDTETITEEVEEIGAGTFEGTRFSSPDTTTETFGIEETITTVASDGGTAITAENESTTVSPEQTPAEPETPAVEEPELPEQTSETAPETVESTAETEKQETEPDPPELEFSEPETAEIPDQVTPATGPTAGSTHSGKPYLESLPEGFGAEVLTVEWLEFLVEEVGIRETARALEYYQTIGWLTEDAATELEEYLDGLEPGDRADLSAEHHLKTLEYVEELTISEQADGREDIK